MSGKPLVSICLVCYNQKQYIRTAVEALFKQTYRPLEIILSDDCSTDGTQAVLRECARKIELSDPYIKVVLSLNEHNLGVLGNCDKAMHQAKGDIVILAAGDDVSYPERAASIAKSWVNSQAKWSCLIHDADRINEDGKIIGHISAGSPWFPVGAAMAYSKQVITRFRPIEHWTAYEDQVYVWRAQLLGEGVTLNETLCGYRVNTGVTKQTSSIKDGEITCIRHWLGSSDQFYRDLEDAKCWLPGAVWGQRKRQLDFKVRVLRGRLKLLTGHNVFIRLSGFFARDWSDGLGNFLYDVFSLFPSSMRDRFIVAVKSLRHKS